MVVKFQEKIIILYDKKSKAYRKRVTVAHELAHCCLNKNMEDLYIEFRLDHDNDNSNKVTANSFAGELLIPEKQISSDYIDLKDEINKLIIQVNKSNLIDQDLSVSKENEVILEKCINKKTASVLLTKKFKSLAQKKISKRPIVKGEIFLQIVFLNVIILLVVANKTLNLKIMSYLLQMIWNLLLIY